MAALGIQGLSQPDEAHVKPQLKSHKALPRKRDLITKESAQTSAHSLDGDASTPSPLLNGFTYSPAPVLPLTPPSFPLESQKTDDIHNEVPSTPVLRVSGNVTPTSRNNPLTPDITPPRVVSLFRNRDGQDQNQPSMSSNAESFATARENLSSSDDDLDVFKFSNPGSLRPCKQRLPHPLRNTTMTSESSPVADISRRRDDGRKSESEHQTCDLFSERKRIVNPSHPDKSNHRRARSAVENNSRTGYSLGREFSLREEVQKTRDDATTTPNLEAFGESIGWPSAEKKLDMTEQIQVWRMSGTSATSTIEAVVIDSPPRKQQTLRHTEKNGSLRSVSTPVRLSRGRDESVPRTHQPRLTHKLARITNEHRASIASDISAPISVNSVGSKPQEDIIPVVVIPQRRSSLKPPKADKVKHSRGRSMNPGQRPATAPDSGIGSFDSYRKKRTMSESLPSASSSRVDPNFKPKIPARRSSLSAPTTRNVSRAGSLTAESLRRLEADHDKPPPPIKIEDLSERIEAKTQTIPSDPRRLSLEPNPLFHPPDQARHSRESAPDPMRLQTPPVKPWTPFQASLQSISPGPIEMGEATAIPLFAHHNESLLVVEQFPKSESNAVRSLRTTVRNDFDITTDGNQTQDAARDHPKPSPLARSRTLQESPAFEIRPPTQHRPSTASAADSNNGLVRRWGSVRRALSARRNSDIIISEPPSTHRVRNRKAGKELDSKLNPFWRPRDFWENFNDDDDDDPRPTPNNTRNVTEAGSDQYIGNSLGIPQKRVVFQGPIALIRRVSQRSRNRVARRTNLSHTSLVSNSYESRFSHSSRSRRGKWYILPLFRLRLPFHSLREMNEWMVRTREQREQEKLEARRNKLKESIGGRIVVDHSTVTATTDPESAVIANNNRER